MYRSYIYRNTTKGKRKFIKVYGEGKINVLPDQAQIMLGVVTEDELLTDAQEENATVMKKVNEALHSIGLTADQIQTVNYSIQPQYEIVDHEQLFKGYRIEHLFQVTIGQIEHVGAVVDTAVSHGANRVLGLNFSVASPTIYEEQSLSQAVLNARRKAEAIAQTLGVRLARVPAVVSEISHFHDGPARYETSTFMKATTPIQPGTLEIRSDVVATFDYDG